VIAFYAKRIYANAEEQQATWGGDNPECEHVWGEPSIRKSKRYDFGTSTLSGSNADQMAQMTFESASAFCARCGAWRGQLGHEPTPDLFVAHLIECFAAVKRVLRDDGTCVCEIGDSYNDKQTRIGIPERFVLAMAADGWRWRDSLIWRHNAMPESVHGWSWQRCRVKIASNPNNLGNSHPSKQPGGLDRIENRAGNSVFSSLVAQWADCPGCDKCRDNGGYVLRRGQWRATVAHSYVYVFSKTNRYYGDGEAVRTALKPQSIERWHGEIQPSDQSRNRPDVYPTFGAVNTLHTIKSGAIQNPNGANLRSVLDIGPEPFTLELCQSCRHVYDRRHYARLLRRDGKRICGCGSTEWVSHYATYPTKLPELFIRAFTSEAGCCPKCQAPLARVIEPSPTYAALFGSNEGADIDRYGMGYRKHSPTATADYKTLGWRPTCRCGAEDSVPATVLDPFCGTGSTLVAAQRNGRDYMGIDCAQDYLDLAAARLAETQAALT